jgi:Tfp pilus assembly protein PilF
MNYKLIALLVLIAVGMGIGGYRYLQSLEDARLAKTRKEAARAVQLAVERQRKAAMLSPQQQDKLVSDAKMWLNEWSGEGEQLAKAKANLDRVLKANPRNVKARMEMARFHILSGHINYRNFQPGSLDKAAWELQYARQADPNSIDVEVLWAHVLYLRGSSREAVKVLQKVESRGAANPWLYQNWAQALMDLSQWSAAETQLRKAQALYAKTDTQSLRVLRALHENLASVLAHQGKLDEADKEYRAVLTLDPGSAWAYGNYADFLLFRRARPDAAIAEAEKAIQLMNYGMAGLTLAAARYAKWAQLKREMPTKAAEYLVLAREGASDFSWIMPQAAKSVDAGPAIQAMVRELMALGVSIDTKDEHGDTGLTLAADMGNVKSIVLLIKYGANIEAADNDGRTAMLIAAYKGHVEVVKALAARRAKLDARDKYGLTALHLAATNRDNEMVRELISLKTNVNVSTPQGYTPLMDAAQVGDERIVRHLLEAGANPNAVTKDTRQSAADLATARGHQALAEYIRAASRSPNRAFESGRKLPPN